MKKYLMTGIAAIMFCGVFTSCSRESDFGGQTQEQKIQETYEEAFISRFGQPSPNLDWGFGDYSASKARTRGVVDNPTITLVGPTFNATMTDAVDKVASVINQDSYSFMKTFESWKNSGWNDNFYQINGTTKDSEYSEDYLAQVRNIILKTIPEGDDNRFIAERTDFDYRVTTKEEGPVTMTPIYHNSSSGDMISYYYYPASTTPTAAEIKALPKYTICNITDPQVCHDPNKHEYFDHKTYSLVYDADGPDGPIAPTYNFPENIKICFIITNNDLVNGTVDIYKGDAVASALESQGYYTVSGDNYIQCGTEVDAISNKVKIRFGNTQTSSKFAAVQQGGINNTNFTHYTRGNGVNGTLIGNSTCYYFKANNQGYLRVGVHQNGGQLKVYESKNTMDLSSENNWNSDDFIELTNDIEVPQSNDGILGFPVKYGYVYAVYSDGGELGYYGYHYHWSKWNEEPAEDKPMLSWLGELDCGTIYNDPSMGFNYIHIMLGKKPAFGKPKSDSSIVGYSALTEGTGINGGLSAGATTYYFKPTESGVLRVAVALNRGKAISIKDLGNDNNAWNATDGRLINSPETVSSKYYGTYDFDVEANHVYAVYAEGSKLGFYGCEFLTRTSSGSSTSNVAKKSVNNYPEFYGDGNLNTEIHQCYLNDYQWLADGWLKKGVQDNTSHIAVFSIGDKNFIGFEDWLDFDYNDVIFEVTNTSGGTEIEEELDEWEEIRVIAEDLSVGQNTDFDFNDIVYDVRRYTKDTQNKHKNGDIEVILRAAGGTLPLFIGTPLKENIAEITEDDYKNYEVHRLFNVDQYTMVNTHADSLGYKGKDNAAPVALSITSSLLASLGVNTATATIGQIARAIPVWVIKNETAVLLDAPDASKGIASKIGVKIQNDGYVWCNEREDIDARYHLVDGTSLFQDWVQGNYIGNDWWTYAKKSLQEYKDAKAAQGNGTNP